MKKQKFTLIFASFALVGIVSSFIPIDTASANFEGYKTMCTTDSNEDSTSAVDGGGDTGEWTQKGTQAYNNAKIIWDQLVKKEGFGGAGAAGAVANAMRESRFDPKAHNVGGGVAGVFQWSGFSNGVNGGRISAGGFITPGNESDLTMENEMKLLHFELNDYKKNAKIAVGNATDPAKAAEDWTVLYEGVSWNNAQAKPEETIGYAKTAYKLFGGDSIPPNSALIGGSDAADSGEASAEESKNAGCDTTENDGSIVDIAKSLLGYFTYEQVHGEHYIGSVENPDKSGQTDCSGFVWLVLKKAGYKVPDDMGWYTKTMEEDAKGDHKWLQEIDESDAGPGDIVIVNTGSGGGSDGHTAIIAEKWKGDETQIIQMGGYSDAEGVNAHKFRESFLSLLEKSHTTTFARPIKG